MKKNFFVLRGTEVKVLKNATNSKLIVNVFKMYFLNQQQAFKVNVMTY